VYVFFFFLFPTSLVVYPPSCSHASAFFVTQITSGLANTVDYFMSIDGAEGDLGFEHYSEQMVRLSTHHSAFLAPLPAFTGFQRWKRGTFTTKTPTTTVSAVEFLVTRFRAHSGLRLLVESTPELGPVALAPPRLPPQCTTGAVYLCPQTLFKV